jgi:hypothetical protein
MKSCPLPLVGIENSVMTPVVVMRPILPGKPDSVNHSAPSGPAVMPDGLPRVVGIGNSVMRPAVVMRPILLATKAGSVNHKAPSGPDVMLEGRLLAVGTGNSVITPVVVMRPTWLVPFSVNHSAPSGPVVMTSGRRCMHRAPRLWVTHVQCRRQSGLNHFARRALPDGHHSKETIDVRKINFRAGRVCYP